jgi:hypothetical protein
MLLSRKTLKLMPGALWLVDGFLQAQPQMWTMNMINGVMKPSLQFIVNQITLYLTAVNLLIAVVQILIPFQGGEAQGSHRCPQYPLAGAQRVLL